MMQLDDDRTLRELLTTCRRLAIIGAKDKPGSAVDMVGRYLLAQGFTIFPVHPMREKVWGLDTKKSLAELVEPVDGVVLFRAAPACPPHAKEVLALTKPPRFFWMQSGIRSPEANAILAGSGIMVVSDRCIKVDHQRLLGSQA